MKAWRAARRLSTGRGQAHEWQGDCTCQREGNYPLRQEDCPLRAAMTVAARALRYGACCRVARPGQQWSLPLQSGCTPEVAQVYGCGPLSVCARTHMGMHMQVSAWVSARGSAQVREVAPR